MFVQGKSFIGTKTAARGRQAHAHISKEIIELCEIIWTHGQIRGKYRVGVLLIIYILWTVAISDCWYLI